MNASNLFPIRAGQIVAFEQVLHRIVDRPHHQRIQRHIEGLALQQRFEPLHGAGIVLGVEAEPPVVAMAVHQEIGAVVVIVRPAPEAEVVGAQVFDLLLRQLLLDEVIAEVPGDRRAERVQALVGGRGRTPVDLENATVTPAAAIRNDVVDGEALPEQRLQLPRHRERILRLGAQQVLVGYGARPLEQRAVLEVLVEVQLVGFPLLVVERMQAPAERLETVQGLRPGLVRTTTEMVAVAVFTSGFGLDAEDAFEFLEHDGDLVRDLGDARTLNEKDLVWMGMVIESSTG